MTALGAPRGELTVAATTTMRCHRRFREDLVAAAPQIAPRRPNPKGAGALRTMPALRRGPDASGICSRLRGRSHFGAAKARDAPWPRPQAAGAPPPLFPGRDTSSGTGSRDGGAARRPSSGGLRACRLAPHPSRVPPLFPLPRGEGGRRRRCNGAALCGRHLLPPGEVAQRRRFATRPCVGSTAAAPRARRWFPASRSSHREGLKNVARRQERRSRSRIAYGIGTRNAARAHASRRFCGPRIRLRSPHRGSPPRS